MSAIVTSGAQSGAPSVVQQQVGLRRVSHLLRSNSGTRLMQKMGCITEDYDAIYQQALLELQQNNSHAQWDFLTAWGSKPNG